MNGPLTVACIINIERVDADQDRAARDQMFGRFPVQIWVTLAVLRSPPVSIPTGADEHCFAVQIMISQKFRLDNAPIDSGRIDDHTDEVSEAIERQRRQIAPLRITMERCVEVSAGVGDQFDPADLKGRPFGVVTARSLAAQMIDDDRAWQPGIGRHSGFDLMTQIDQSGWHMMIT